MNILLNVQMEAGGPTVPFNFIERLTVADREYGLFESQVDADVVILFRMVDKGADGIAFEHLDEHEYAYVYEQLQKRQETESGQKE